jgi:acyl carrier protein phosphodiesterase
MNFLAHAHLSGDNDYILIGNFVADAVKGNGLLDYHQDMQKGIRLHRRIDTFTDTHPIFKESLKRVRPDFGKFAGIVVDIYYDHFLAKGWSNYSDRKLTSFASHVYKVLQHNYKMLPARTKRILPFLVTQNWLVGYANLDDLRLVFYGMDRRTGFKSGMNRAVEVLEIQYDSLKNDFERFYPLLQDYASKELEQLIDEEGEK